MGMLRFDITASLLPRHKFQSLLAPRHLNRTDRQSIPNANCYSSSMPVDAFNLHEMHAKRATNDDQRLDSRIFEH